MSRILNSLLGHAIGDALGEPFEFANPSPSVVRAAISGKAALRFSDDTQMMLATLHGLLECPIVDSVCTQYLHWYDGQMGKDRPSHLLWGHEQMTRRMAPGMTCMTSLANLSRGKPVINDSKGCGTVMRQLPFLFLPDQQLARSLALVCAQLTHKHAEIGVATEDFFAVAKVLNVDKQQGWVLLDEHRKAGGWTALSCLMWAAWAVRTSDTFEDCMVKSIAHDGDSDSIAAVAGGLWGWSDKPQPDWERYAARLEGVQIVRDGYESWVGKYGDMNVKS